MVSHSHPNQEELQSHPQNFQISPFWKKGLNIGNVALQLPGKKNILNQEDKQRKKLEINNTNKRLPLTNTFSKYFVP